MLNSISAQDIIKQSGSSSLLHPANTGESKKLQVVLKSSKSLSSFFKIGKYHDFTIIDSNHDLHYLHKLILACHR